METGHDSLETAQKEKAMTECQHCGTTMKMMKFADDDKARRTCPDCGWRKGKPFGWRTMTTDQIYAMLSNMGGDVSFVANVIRTHHRNPAAKLKGLYALVISGHSVRTGSCDIDVLVIDGVKVEWAALEAVGRAK
jgi:hypothetical protein